jgi:phosphoenolpyruvate carboxylase
VQAAAETLRGLSSRQKADLARAYTVYLELVNICETAYRTHRLRQRWREAIDHESSESLANVVFVFTAHPTESRSPTNVRLMRQGQSLLIDALERSSRPDMDRLKHVLHLVWRAGTHPPHKPTVADEARHLFSLLDDPILEELLRMRDEGHRVRLRTWVGGDKDGHPGVGPEETSASLNLSRARLLEFVQRRLMPSLRGDVELLADGLRDGLAALEEQLAGLGKVGVGDGRRIVQLRESVGSLGAEYARRRGRMHPALRDLVVLLDCFPGLVVPVELREERGQFSRGAPIADMLHTLGDVAQGGEVLWYVCGCVVSMTGAPEDLFEAEQLVRAVLGGPKIPVIPLFELPDVLRRATSILDGALADAAFRESVEANHNSIEVMLGYSDTSKRMGVLASRLAINETMKAIGAWGAQRKVNIYFFHGSGGSVGRGGGSVEDQAATWPPGASDVVKQTLQGEMVERTLATAEILRSQVLKIAAIQHRPPEPRPVSGVAMELGKLAEETYVDVLASDAFFELLRRATPYTRLGTLTIGSRPVSRAAAESPTGLEQLRAIPWVLCWTQTRYLLHAWLGVGSAWRAMRDDPQRRAALVAALKVDPLLSSYVRMLGFTLAKTAPLVWREYVRALSGGEPAILARLEQEREDALDLALLLSPDGELLSYRPWLRESIYYRASMIHPLNLLQIEVLAAEELSDAQLSLFRETVTGVAAGMLTTG